MSCAVLTSHPSSTVLESANCEALSALIYCIVLLTDCALVVWSV